jgi:hypothetical protein
MKHVTLDTANVADPSAEIPIACDLHVFSEADRAAHFDLSTEALVRWPTEREELPDGYLFSYQGSEERFLALSRWAAAEHRCCPWAAYSVEMGPFEPGRLGTIRVRITAPPEGKAFLTSAYEYLGQLQGERPPESIMNPAGVLRRASILEKLKAGCKC